MRLRQVGLASAVAAAMTAGAASAQDANVAQSWTVSARVQADQPVKVLCVLNMQSGEGRVTLRNTLKPKLPVEQAASGSAFLTFDTADKLAETDRADLQNVSFRIADQKSWAEGPARWTAGKTGGGTVSRFVEDRIESALDGLARGKTLEMAVTLSDGTAKTYSFGLAGSSQAVKAFRVCLN